MPTRALGALMFIGFLDLFMTAVLHAKGQIVELNPLMRPLITQSEWLFVGVKGLTLVAAWIAMVWYARQNLRFVRQVCLAGSVAYLFIWTTWFIAAS